MFELTQVQLVVVAALGAFAAWQFFLTDAHKNQIKALFNKVTGKGGSVSAPSVSNNGGSTPSRVELVEAWERLKNKLNAAGLEDAERELDELWKLLNVNPQKETK